MVHRGGPYDYWAVEYGYTSKGGASDLNKIAERVAENGLAYGTDEDMWSSDPLINRWDLGNDPLEYAKQRIALSKQVQEKLLDRAVKKGESYAKLRTAFRTVLSERLRSGILATRFVGGHYMHRDHRGDPNERAPIVPVEVAKQREALALIRDHIFADKAWDFSPDFLNKLAASRWSHWGAYPDRQVEFRIHDRILTAQTWVLTYLLAPNTLELIYDAEMRVPKEQDVMTLPELFETITDSICGEVFAGPSDVTNYTARNPLISSVRRNLQREYFNHLIEISMDAGGGWFGPMYPRAAKTLAWYELKRIHEELDALLSDSTDGLDRYTLSHLEESRERIKRALEASFSLNGSSGGGGFFIFRKEKEKGNDE